MFYFILGGPLFAIVHPHPPPQTPRCHIKYHPEKHHNINSIHTLGTSPNEKHKPWGGRTKTTTTTTQPCTPARTDKRRREQSSGLETDALSIGKRLEVK